MDGRKKSLVQVLVAAALMMAGGAAARGEAMAKASIDPTENVAPAAAPVIGGGNASAAAVTPSERVVDDLPAAFQLPVAGAPHSTAAKTTGDVIPAVAPRTEDGTLAAHTADAAAITPAKPPVQETPKLSELEASPIGGSASTVTPVKSETGNGKPAGSSAGGVSGLTNALQVATALTVVIGLIFIGKALAKKFVPGAKASNGKGVIEILARYPLCKNQSLVLVRIGSQIVTLNQCKESSQSVLVISEPGEVAKLMGQIEGQSPNSIQAGFTKMLANARMDLEDPQNDPDRNDFELRSMEPENLDNQLEEMASAKRQLMQLRQQVRSVRDSLPRS